MDGRRRLSLTEYDKLWIYVYVMVFQDFQTLNFPSTNPYKVHVPHGVGTLNINIWVQYFFSNTMCLLVHTPKVHSRLFEASRP